jgi:hypothetical protein
MRMRRSRLDFMRGLPLANHPVIGDLHVQCAIRWIARQSLSAVYMLSWSVTAAAGFYGATIIFGFAAGYTLPSASVFAVLPSAHLISDLEPFLPWPLLGVAAIGAVCGWTAAAGILPVEDLQAQERRLIRFWSRAGFPVILLAFVFAMSGGGWSGRFRPFDLNYFSIGGLVPHSDALAYFGGTFDLAYAGHWNTVASWRPFAAAFRELTVFAAGFSYVDTLLVQAVLLTGAFMFALRSAVAWCGIWVAIALMALLYGLVRPFLLTTMTEPLGLVWSLVSLSFFIEALRQRSVYMATVAFAALLCGLLIRMGSMLTGPFLMLWIVVSLTSGRASRIKVSAILAGVLVVIWAYNGLLANAYAAPVSRIGGNFSMVVCGLAHGGDWTKCFGMFGSEIRAGHIVDVDKFFLGEAARAFIGDPIVAVRYMLWNMWQYIEGLPDLLLLQYTPIADIHDKFIVPFMIFLIPGWVYLFKEGKDLTVLSFALVVLVSTTLSAALIFGSDGPRAMHVTHPLVAMIFASGFAAPLNLRVPDERPILTFQAGAGAIGALMLILLIGPPLISHVVRSMTAYDAKTERNQEDIRIVPGQRFLTGFLVVPDAADLPRDKPALHVSTFTRIFPNLLKSFSPIDTIDPEFRLSELLPQAPFAMVYSRAQNSSDTLETYLAPSTVLSEKSPRRWSFRLGKQPSRSSILFGLRFRRVEEANPVESRLRLLSPAMP